MLRVWIQRLQPIAVALFVLTVMCLSAENNTSKNAHDKQTWICGKKSAEESEEYLTNFDAPVGME